MYRLYRVGDSGPPCLTPTSISKTEDSDSLSAVVVYEYMDSKSSISTLFSLFGNLCLIDLKSQSRLT